MIKKILYLVVFILFLTSLGIVSTSSPAAQETQPIPLETIPIETLISTLEQVDTPTATSTITVTETLIPTWTLAPTGTPTNTWTPWPTATETGTSTPTITRQPTATPITPTPTITRRPTLTPSLTLFPTSTITRQPTATEVIPTTTLTRQPTLTPKPENTKAPIETAVIPTQIIITIRPFRTLTPSPPPLPTWTSTSTRTPTPTASVTPTPTETFLSTITTTPEVIVSTDEVIIPKDLPQAVRLEQPSIFRIVDFLSLILSIYGIINIGLMIYRWKKWSLVYIIVWLFHATVYLAALFMNYFGFLTIEYSDVIFIRWSRLLIFHILLVGALHIRYAWKRGDHRGV